MAGGPSFTVLVSMLASRLSPRIRVDDHLLERLAHELAAMLEGRLADTELRAFHGRKVLEVRPLWINKGVVAERFIAHCGARDDIFPDFRLAIGDDRTDEDLFQAAGPDAWTILVGRHPTRARFTLPTPAEVIQLLSRLDAIDGRTPVPGA